MTQASNNPRRSARKSKVDIGEIVHELEDLERSRKNRRKFAAIYGGVAAGGLLLLASGAVIIAGNGDSFSGSKTLGQASATAKTDGDDDIEIVAGFEADPPQGPVTVEPGPAPAGSPGSSNGLSVTAIAGPPTTNAPQTLPPPPIVTTVTTAARGSASSDEVVLGAGVSPDATDTDLSVDLAISTEADGNEGGGTNGSNGGNGNGGGGNGGGGNGGGDNGDGNGGGGDDNGDGASEGDNALISLNVGGNTVTVAGDEGLLAADLNDDGVLTGVVDGAGNLFDTSGDEGGLPGVSLDVGLGSGGSNTIGVDAGGSAGNGLLGVELGGSSDETTDESLIELDLLGIGVGLNTGSPAEESGETGGLIEIDLGGLF